MRCGELSAPKRGCPCRWSKKSAGVVFRERDSSHPLPFGLSLLKPFTSFERTVEPFARLRVNGGGDGALRQADRGLEGGFQSLRVPRKRVRAACRERVGKKGE